VEVLSTTVKPQAVQHLAEQQREHDLVLQDQVGEDHQVQPVSLLA
jgi:hypothetical protein